MRGVVLDGAVYLTHALIESMVQEPVWPHPVLHRRRRVHRRQRTRACLGGEDGPDRDWPAGSPPNSPRTTSGSTWSRPAASTRRRDNPEWYQGRMPNAAGIPLGPSRPCRRDRRDLPVPGQRRQRLHHRPDDPRQRRQRLLLIEEATAARVPLGPPRRWWSATSRRAPARVTAPPAASGSGAPGQRSTDAASD